MLDLNDSQPIDSWNFNDDNGIIIEDGSAADTATTSRNKCERDASSSPVELPSQDQLIDLTELFFEKLYHFLPILHKESILSRIRDHDNESDRLLLFALSAVTASFHPNREIQDCQDRWFSEAKILFCSAVHLTDHPLQTLQAANLIIYQAMLVTDYCTAWMVLGETWRKAVAMGCSILDGPTKRNLLGLGTLPCRNWPEVEECRRSMWMLFILDRGMCFPIGLEHAIDDRRLCLNLPMADRDFQSRFPPEDHIPILYSPNFSQLTTVMYADSLKKSTNSLQHLVVGYILFGRITSLVFGPEADSDIQSVDLQKLASYQSTLNLMLPLSATRLSAANYNDHPYVVWLNVLLNVSSVFLYHRPSSDGEEGAEIHWVDCMAAARNTVTIIRDASRMSIELIINPHLATMFLTCARILIIEYLSPSVSQQCKDPTLLEDIKILYYASEKLNGALQALGRKFRNGLMFYLQQNEQQVLEGKAGGAKDLLKSCDQWPDFPDSEGIQFPV